jgi:hypothetical protein
MTSINQKTALVAIVAIAAVLAVSTIGRAAFAADTETTTITKHTNNTGVNDQMDTAQKQNCETAGGASPIGGTGEGASGSCTATSSDTITQSGGVLKK